MDLLWGKFRVRASDAGVGSGSYSGGEEDGSQSSSLDQSPATSSERLLVHTCVIYEYILLVNKGLFRL